MNKKVLIVIALLVIGVAFVVCLSIDGESNTQEFKLTKSDIINNKISIEYTEVSSLDKYIIEIKKNDDIVYKTINTGTTFEVELDNLINGTEYVLSVYADLGNDKTEKIVDDYKFVWNNPKFVRGTVLLNNNDYTLNIDASLNSGEYSISIIQDDKELLKESLDNNEFVISKEYYENKKTTLTAYLLKGEVRIDEIKLYNNIDPLTDISITSIENNSALNLANVLLELDGGDNADYYNVKIYNDKKMVKEFNTHDKITLLSKNIFEVKKKYRIVVTAICGEYKREKEVNFNINEYEQASPVYISNDWNNVKKGTKLTLASSDNDVKILYTIDGSDPVTKGIEYKDQIVVDKDFTLKTVAISTNNKKANSIVKTYDVKVGEKKNLAVYISPSNQFRNIGVEEVGYTNEMDEMNDLSQYIIERLESKGVKVYRNNPSQKIKDWVKESNEYKVDLHLAVHSNASNNHDEYGIETWIHNDSSKTLSLANLIQKNLSSIYYNKDRKDYNRGVRYAAGALGEVNEKNLEFGILIEVAHHDDKDDAKWIMEHKKDIGYNIADSILKYYQVIE